MLALSIAAGGVRADGGGAATERTVRRASAAGGNTAGAAAWCDHYTIGPGDVFNFNLYGHPELRRDKSPSIPTATSPTCKRRTSTPQA